MSVSCTFSLLILSHTTYYILCLSLPPPSQISALGMDPSGARVITGGYDYTVRLWDFAGMDSRLKSFRSITPCERFFTSHDIVNAISNSLSLPLFVSLSLSPDILHTLMAVTRYALCSTVSLEMQS